MARLSGNTQRGPVDWRRILCVVLAVLIIPGILYAIHAWESGADKRQLSEAAGTVVPAAPRAPELTFFGGGWYTPKEKLETTLIIGVDNNDERRAQNLGSGQADFLLLLVADRTNQKYTAIHLNRDTMTDVLILTNRGAPVRTVTAQLALSHSYGGSEERACRNTIRAVSHLMRGMEIDHYASISMDSISVLNDAVGGVPVEVMDDFSGFDDSLVQGQTVTLMGDQAELYVRARLGMAIPTNLHRMERQQQYLVSFQERFKRAAEADSSFVLNTLLEISDDLHSDCTVEQLSTLINTMEGYELTGYESLPGSAKTGTTYMEYYLDEQAFRALIMNVFYERVDDM